MHVGYIRVSSPDQKLDRQIDLMDSEKVAKVFEDKASGANAARPGLKELLTFVRKGDVIVVESLSRLARSTKDLLEIVDQIERKGVSLVSKKESFDTASPQGMFMLTIFGALATLERENLLDRQREGIAAAKARGRHLGRPRLSPPKGWGAVSDRWRNGEITATEAMKLLGLKKSSFYKLVHSSEAGQLSAS